MSKATETWYSHRIHRRITVSRWGAMGTPVLLFPTAAGDAEEVERFQMIDALAPLLEACRVKVYSIDSVAGKAWINEDNSIENATRVQEQFDQVVVHEVVPAIRHDCGYPEHVDVVVAGASIGAFNALASICRHPDLFSTAICMSGTYDVRKFMSGHEPAEWSQQSPLHFVPHIPEPSDHLNRLRERFVLLTHGEGRWEDPQESWRVAHALGARGIPNRVDAWGKEWDHDWITWRKMLPHYLDELVPRATQNA